MSAQTVETILSRAMSDGSFADQLFTNPDQALAGFELTAEEVVSLKGISRADIETYSTASPEERRSFSLGIHGSGGLNPYIGGNHNETALHVN
jgi:hypothetical protein